MSKNNVHPDHYKTAGRDRQDDAAAARQARAMAAKGSSRERPDRMSKEPYFQRPEPAPGAVSGRPTERAQKPPAARRATAKASATESAGPKASAPSKRRTGQKPKVSLARRTGRSARVKPGPLRRAPQKKK